MHLHVSLLELKIALYILILTKDLNLLIILSNKAMYFVQKYLLELGN